MSRLRYIVWIMLLSKSLSYAQLSPGDLSQAHAHLEGMSKCTECHDIGKKVNNNKCLVCHKEIKALITEKSGYHSSTEVKSKDCFVCHSEHHGRKFDMARFDQKKFDHALTTYKLDGAHAVIECKACHRPENISDVTIKKKKDTFLGLKEECKACHADYHQNTLSQDCLLCHDTESFRPAPKFDHDRSKFKLTGKHTAIDCKACHALSTRNGKQFQQFVGVSHSDCKSCHKDPHNNRIPGKCTQCHNDKSFEEFVGRNRFDHSATEFNLKGKHASVDCFKCHQAAVSPATVFAFSAAVSVSQCVSCHKDVHAGKMGNDCAKCHNETSFLSVRSISSFDHSTTDFPLEGKHVGVDCKKCHKGKYTDPVNFSSCKNCHGDYHQGEFVKNNKSPDCAECHSVKNAFSESSYSIDSHQRTAFPLTGSHAATPCFSCHLSNNRWSFKNRPTACAECHDNVHGDQFRINGTTRCERCHVTETWNPDKFDHSLTRFPLDGRHAGLDCRLCHKPVEKDGLIKIEYTLSKFQCIDCHQ